MQDDPSPKKKHICQGKKYLFKSRMTPKNKMSAKKKYCTIINCVHLIHKACQILPTFIS